MVDRSTPKIKPGQAPLPGMSGDMGQAARAKQWRELRESAQHAVTVMRRHGHVALLDAADRLERAVNAMPTL